MTREPVMHNNKRSNSLKRDYEKEVKVEEAFEYVVDAIKYNQDIKVILDSFDANTSWAFESHLKAGLRKVFDVG